ncbi:hypothetical protein BC941DRAFT_413637 [Chlamydoabsidia padenii]|nr:hypothetical protein BC941DRAFT_413637 [Chlamydoabsidia padenii]
MAKSKKKSTQQQQQQQSNDTTVIPAFPRLTPKSHLTVTELERHQIYLIPQFFTLKECQSLITYFDTHLRPQTVPSTIKKGEAYRNNDRQSLYDPTLADMIWTHMLSTVCGTEQGIHSVSLPRRPCGLNSNLRIYRYRPGQRFEAHYDDSVKDAATGHWTDWTLLIYLNGGDDGLQGGETVFYKDDMGKKKKTRLEALAVVRPEPGLALLHRHGQHCLLHEALEVTHGSKWVLRSDVLIG